MSKSLIDSIGRPRAEALMADAVSEATARADAQGLPQVVKIGGVWCRRYPDGRTEALDAPSPTAGAAAGSEPQEPMGG